MYRSEDVYWKMYIEVRIYTRRCIEVRIYTRRCVEVRMYTGRKKKENVEKVELKIFSIIRTLGNIFRYSRRYKIH